MTLIGVLRADYEQNTRILDRISVTVFRLNQAARRGRLAPVKKPLAKILDIIWLQMIVGAELPGALECGPGLRLPHGGRGVIVNANSRIGSGVTLYHRVTLGVAGADPHNVPSLGDRVYVGTGATLVGRIHVGDDAKVGAGAVVTKDVPAAHRAVGVPARSTALA